MIRHGTDICLVTQWATEITEGLCCLGFQATYCVHAHDMEHAKVKRMWPVQSKSLKGQTER